MTTSWCSVGAYPERYAASMTTHQRRFAPLDTWEILRELEKEPANMAESRPPPDERQTPIMTQPAAAPEFFCWCCFSNPSAVD
jgi:hypothetical protein